MTDSVKSVVFVKPRKLEVRSFQYPEKIPQDAMMVKMEMAGVCGTDKYMFEGKLPVEFPVIPGHENLGRVYEVGVKAAKEMEVHDYELSEGDRVVWVPYAPCGKCYGCKWLASNMAFYCSNPQLKYGELNCSDPKNKPWLSGGWGQFVYIRPSTWVYRVPRELPSDVAVLIDTLVSVRGVETAMSPMPSIREGFAPLDTVLIQGSGPIGVMAAVKAKVCGAGRIIMTGGPDWRLKLAKDFGVDETINIEDVSNPDDRVKEVLDLTEGVGADMVVECTGIASAVPEGIDMLRLGGTYVIIGCYADVGPTEIYPHKLLQKNVRLIGQKYAAPQQYDRDLKLLNRYKSQFPFQKLLTHKFDVEEAESALAIQKEYKSMKIAIVPKD